ncbi:hypothetical protein HF086_008014 [Spodoptera exigua]|uniref:Tr-type G domain-containing protein n=1 Tax=Spodoptera exigua TaxID=7107 RepID=A0A922M4D0_SPOEX|nr:hypothetical protein HF086_008014 [Spodoptera exigua]
MYKSFLFRRLPLNLIKHEFVSQAYIIKKAPLNNSHQWARQLSISYVCCKKRRSPEEKEAESQGRQSIRYSPKSAEVVGIWRNMTVQEIANVLNKDVDHVLKALDFADKNSDVVYTEKTVIHNPQIIRDVVKISGCRFKIVAKPEQDLGEEENKDAVPAPPAPPEALRPRPPVVCVMGHVDHGKTTLLDALRDTSVVDQEFGGITQHIGAFEVQLASGEKVTFLDTPGHAAFTAMRSRGAHATDIVVLVVAADDGVMEQTERTMRALATQGIICEALGGDIQAIPVSALKKQNLDTLVEALTLQAQLMELKADPGGYVEAEGRVVQEAPPSTPVSVLGWRELPSAGDQVLEVSSEIKSRVDLLTLRVGPKQKRASEVMRWRQAQRMKEKQAADVEAIAAKDAQHQQAYAARLARKRALGRYKLRAEGPREKMIQEDTHPTLTVIVKGDVDGSVEAILDILETYDEHERVKLDLVHFGVGPVTPNDLEQFLVTENKKKVPVAGCRCVKGSLAKNALYRVIRGQEVVFEGKLASMKHLKDEVPTIKRDMECGLRFEEPFDVQPGDTVVCYKMVDAADTTSWDPGF